MIVGEDVTEEPSLKHKLLKVSLSPVNAAACAEISLPGLLKHKLSSPELALPHLNWEKLSIGADTGPSSISETPMACKIRRES